MQKGHEKVAKATKRNAMEIPSPWPALLADGEIEAQPALLPIHHGNASAMQQHSVFHDGQPQSGSSHLSTPSLIHPVKTFEQTWQMVGLHAYPIVVERENVL